MARDEADMLPRWVDYYGGQLGPTNLLVLDDGSTDGSTDNLPCTCYHLPPSPSRSSWVNARKKLTNGIAQGLLAWYDFVVFADVDEFLVPDPARYSGLLDYISAHADRDVVAPLAVNVLHNPLLEPALDSRLPVLAQRHLVKFAPSMCKPLLKAIPAEWSPGFHGIKAPFDIDRDLLMLHLKYYDASSLATVAELRHALFQRDGRGGEGSGWTLSRNDTLTRLLAWVTTPEGVEVPEFDPGEPAIDTVVRPQPGGFFRSVGPWLAAMETGPLRRLPERFQTVI